MEDLNNFFLWNLRTDRRIFQKRNNELNRMTMTKLSQITSIIHKLQYYAEVFGKLTVLKSLSVLRRFIVLEAKISDLDSPRTEEPVKIEESSPKENRKKKSSFCSCM